MQSKARTHKVLSSTSKKAPSPAYNPVLVLSSSAMLVALGVALRFATLNISEFLRISFTFLPIVMAGALFGYQYGAAVGILADILGFFALPSGTYFPGFTLCALLEGLLAALFFYRKTASLWRVILYRLLVTALISIGLNTLWLTMLYGKGFWVLLPARALKSLLVCPVEIALVFSSLKVFQRLPFLSKRKNAE